MNLDQEVDPSKAQFIAPLTPSETEEQFARSIDQTLTERERFQAALRLRQRGDDIDPSRFVRAATLALDDVVRAIFTEEAGRLAEEEDQACQREDAEWSGLEQTAPVVSIRKRISVARARNRGLFSSRTIGVSLSRAPRRSRSGRAPRRAVRRAAPTRASSGDSAPPEPPRPRCSPRAEGVRS